MVAGAGRTLASATARSEDRTRGRKGVVVGAALRRPCCRVVDGARDPRSLRQRFRRFPRLRAWRRFLERGVGLVRAPRRVCRVQHCARRGAALPGLLLPRMRAVFGKGDWVANGVLFTLYHLHVPWVMPGTLVEGILLEAYPTRRFQSAWMGIIVHSVQSVFVIAVVLTLVLK
jgi:Type II CAAX prenyl endopeptidase Rce1-like